MNDQTIGGIDVMDSFQSRRMLDEMHDREVAYQTNKGQLLDSFLTAALTGEMSDSAPFGQTVTRYTNYWPDRSGGPIQRKQTVGEVLADSLDYTNGPQFDEVLSILCAVAKGENKTQEAKTLILRMADKWSEMHSED